MKEWLDLLENKILALVFVGIFLLTVYFALPLVPIVFFITIPTALILTFSNENFVDCNRHR